MMRVTFDTEPHTGTMIGINTDNNKAIVKLDNGDEIEAVQVSVDKEYTLMDAMRDLQDLASQTHPNTCEQCRTPLLINGTCPACGC